MINYGYRHQKRRIEHDMSEHLAILRQPWMKYIINGKKTIESRISQRRIAPYRKVEKNDWIYFRLSGDFTVTHKAQVDKVLYYQGKERIFRVLKRFKQEICIDDEYIQSKHKCQYLTLIWLNPVIDLGIDAFPFVKKDQRAWVCNFREIIKFHKLEEVLS